MGEAEQLEIVERICAPILEAFYTGSPDPSLLEPSERKRVAPARVLWERIQFSEGRAD